MLKGGEDRELPKKTHKQRRKAGGREGASRLGVGMLEGFTLVDKNYCYNVVVNPEQWWIILGVAHPSVR